MKAREKGACQGRYTPPTGEVWRYPLSPYSDEGSKKPVDTGLGVRRIRPLVGARSSARSQRSQQFFAAQLRMRSIPTNAGGLPQG
jgi:hypothetical protein